MMHTLATAVSNGIDHINSDWTSGVASSFDFDVLVFSLRIKSLIS
jgi:hypothetical protein